MMAYAIIAMMNCTGAESIVACPECPSPATASSLRIARKLCEFAGDSFPDTTRSFNREFSLLAVGCRRAHARRGPCSAPRVAGRRRPRTGGGPSRERPVAYEFSSRVEPATQQSPARFVTVRATI